MSKYSPRLPFSIGATVALLATPLAPCVSLNAGAQSFTRHGLADQRFDSVAMLRAARGAQSRFERVRFNNLPWTWRSGSGECDEIIGRYCITHGDGDDKWIPPEEPRRVAQERHALVLALDSAARTLPGDGWLAGQLVRYLLEANRHDDAHAATKACRSARWWCTALAGFVQHDRGRFREADSLFKDALPLMPEKERLRWTDLAMVLTGDDLRLYRQSAPEQRQSLASRFWWLADPFWMREGNDRRTEHYSRYVIDQINQNSRNPEAAFWGSDLGEILIRYGVMVGWERVRPVGGEMSLPGVVGHFAPNGREFLPQMRWVANPESIDAMEWKLEADGTRTEYAPSYASSFRALDHQLAVFRRGDSAIIVAAYQLPVDSTPPTSPIEVGLIIASDENATLASRRVSMADARGVLTLAVPSAPAAVSIEALADSGSRAYRARYGLPLRPANAPKLSVSDVLLLEGGGGFDPRSLPEASVRARGSVKVHSAERISLYWEVYGLNARSESLDVELALEPLGRKWLRRTAERMRLRAERPSVTLRWSDLSLGEPMLARALELELPRLPKGHYVLRITVRRGTEEAVSKRHLITG